MIKWKTVSSHQGSGTLSETRTVHVRIEGRVQGVGYRAWTEQTARHLGLCGWVRNRHDGWVEAVFHGAPAAVNDMLRLCADGPRDAEVTNVEIVGEGVGVFDYFKIKPTL